MAITAEQRRRSQEILEEAAASGNPAAQDTLSGRRRGPGTSRRRQRAWEKKTFPSQAEKDKKGASPESQELLKQMAKLAPVKEAGAKIESTQERDIEAMTEAEKLRQRQARGQFRDMQQGQKEAMEGFDTAEEKAEQGVEEVREAIGDTRESMEDMPEQVQTEFDRQATRLDDTLSQARTGLESQRSEAIGNVMAGQSQALQAATQTIHGQSRAQKSQIDAMIQQGQISPSQGAAMKAKVGLSSAMALAPAIGQTIHAFTATQAQVATSFGSMFTNLESAGAQTTGQLGAAAGQAYASTQQAVGQFNTRLTELDSQITGQRSALYSQNAAARSQAQHMNDTHNMAMLDHIGDQVILHSPAAMNNYQVQREIFADTIKTEQGVKMLELYEKNQKMGELQGLVGMLGTVGQLVGGSGIF